MARKPKGQSLLEFAISAALLIMLLSGIVDLGRAYFARVAMDSIISEGAHWAAAYPGCIPTANNASGASYIPVECRGTNSVVGRMLNENNDLDRARFTAMSFSPLTAAPGMDFTISVSYRMDTVTPFITAMFGPSWTLTAEVKEVVRGGGLPKEAGTPMTDQGGINPVRLVSNFQQQGACNSGNVTLSWTAVPASGYYIYPGQQTAPPYTGRLATITPGGTPGATLTWTGPLGYGNSQDYTITAFNDVGGVITESPSAFLPLPAHCSQIKPTIDPPPGGWICASLVPPFGAVTFNWTMPAPIDADVTGYQVLRVDGASYTLVATASGSATISASYTFTSGGPGSDQNKPYVVRPVLSGIPDPTNDSDPVTIDCLPGTGLSGEYFNNTTLTAPPAAARTDPTVDFNWGIASPDGAVNPDFFSVRWTGKLKAKYTEQYTFCINNDDGVRLWFDADNDGTLDPTPKIDDWTIHSASLRCWTTPSSLVAETKYAIKIEYFENTGNAVMQLNWQSATETPSVIVPQSYLYP